MSRWSEGVHDWMSSFFERADGGGRLEEDRWERPGGGGGWTRVMTEGTTFEKVGVNRSVVHGALSQDLADRLLLTDADRGRFFATGVSVVCHPRSPRIPIVHLNVRYFHVDSGTGVERSWFGGGIDLTPTYPDPADARHFHRVLRDTCDAFDENRYAGYKAECDAYFVNRHRSDEPRGVGGVFFDHLAVEPGHAPERSEPRRFVDAIAHAMEPAYGPLVERHRDDDWGPRERKLQLLRRGRYVEFNLVHDRGTRFGLETSARIESVLMSLPPTASWPYDPQFEAGSIEDRLHQMLVPRDWADS